MDTNFHMLQELDKAYTPETFGVLNSDETMLINQKLHIEEMDKLQLQNLRDFVVLFYSSRERKNGLLDVNWDKMSAITTVIDVRMFTIGTEV